jgi:hypothetical protein
MGNDEGIARLHPYAKTTVCCGPRLSPVSWRWRDIGVGEVEVDRVRLFLDLGHEGRRARITVAGGDKAFGFYFCFAEELTRDEKGGHGWD